MKGKQLDLKMVLSFNQWSNVDRLCDKDFAITFHLISIELNSNTFNTLKGEREGMETVHYTVVTVWYSYCMVKVTSMLRI